MRSRGGGSHIKLIVTAPAKVVVWGEYAVLADAPAAVMAIDRTATVSLETDRLTRFTASGPLFCGYHGTPARLVGCDASTVVDSILSFWGYANYPDTWSIHSDTRAMYDASGSKYGVGSSAAGAP